jgi:ribosome-binding factor A
VSHRLEQVGSTLHRAIQDVLARGLSDPRIGGMITVTGVDVSADMKTATVRVSVLPEKRQALTMHGLRDAAAHVRHKVGDLVAMREVPQLWFKLDTSLKRQAEVLDAIAKVAAERELAEKSRGTGATAEAGGAAEPGPDGATNEEARA